MSQKVLVGFDAKTRHAYAYAPGYRWLIFGQPPHSNTHCQEVLGVSTHPATHKGTWLRSLNAVNGCIYIRNLMRRRNVARRQISWAYPTHPRDGVPRSPNYSNTLYSCALFNNARHCTVYRIGNVQGYDFSKRHSRFWDFEYSTLKSAVYSERRAVSVW